jgi:hypothetical protein
MFLGPVSKFFSVPGEPHAWDTQLYLGDPRLRIVEEAWDELERVVQLAI